MVLLELHNRFCYLREASTAVLRRLGEVTSYRVENYFFMKAYKERRWDGKEKLLTFSRRDGYKFPIGLLSDVMATLDEHYIQYQIVHRQRDNNPEIELSWNKEAKLRDYQKEAVAAVLSDDIYYGMGILKLPPRSGKTRTAGRIIYEIGRKTLFVVSSQLLLHQTKKALEYLLEREIGIIGDSKAEIEDVTVATVQSLMYWHEKRKKEFAVLKKCFDLLIVDEIHHLKGKAWKSAVMQFECRYRLGLSATVYFENVKEFSRGIIWTKAICGDIVYEKSLSWMIENGYLVKPTIEIYKVTKPDLTDQEWSPDMHKEAIYKNHYRNNLIVELTKKQVEKDLNVLIVSNRIVQVKEIEKICQLSGVEYVTVTGSTHGNARLKLIERFTSGQVPVLIGTVFGEGVDIPEIQCVINAEGGSSAISTIQRLRNLTPHKNKDTALFIEFADMTNEYFAGHSQRRIAKYREEYAFDLKVMKA